jgi:hypothetical protein
MKHPWLFMLPFASLCPFNAFGFPSVSPFCGASNPDWLNELRSDYPVNSTCVEWSYFYGGPDRDGLCVSLPSNDSASLKRCSWRFPFLADGRCGSFSTFVHALGPCAADSHGTWRSTATGRTEFFVDRDSCSAIRRPRVCCPLEPIWCAGSSDSHSCPQFLVMHTPPCAAALETNATSCVQNVRTVHVALAWVLVHSVGHSEGKERSRTCFKAEEQ